MAHLQLQNFEEALADADAALQIDNGAVKAYYRKGMALEGLQRKQEALESFQKILEIEPKNKAALQKLTELREHS